MQSLFAKQILTTEGWHYDVRVDVEHGVITAITPATVGTAQYDLLLPGMPNVHSHAFQWAMGGLTEHAGNLQSEQVRGGEAVGFGAVAPIKKEDNFWSWREVMYRFLERLTPEHIEVIARAFYIECLKSGYTAMGEFHYLHNDANGNAYDNPAELSERIIYAAQDVGIHLTLLPVLYQTSNFGGVPAVAGQRRFLHSTDAFLKLLHHLQAVIPAKAGISNQQTPAFAGVTANVVLGAAPHSLRAVPPEALREIISAFPRLPIHTHAAEQEKEVADCLAWSGKRPVEWLLENCEVNERWCLIHSTHLNAAEVAGLAKSGAVAGLCPSTEANLGDGIFPAEEYLAAGGRFGIGSDSHITVNPFDELRLMEYAQRLHHRRRNVLCDESIPAVGRNLYTRAVAGGRQALGIGDRADLIAVDCSAPLLQSKQGDALLNSLIFVTSQPRVTDVFVAGKKVITNGHHPLEVQANAQLAQTMREILS